MPTWLAESDLREIESLLGELGFDPGPIDGVVDKATLSAIKQYQEFASLPGEPEPSKALLNELRGVAAAFAALRNDSASTTTAAAPAPDSETTAGEVPEEPAPDAPAPEPVEPEAAAPAPSEAEPSEPEITELEVAALEPSEAEPSEPEAGEPEIAESGTGQPVATGPDPAGKIIVPPPPAPPKLKPLEAIPEAAPPPQVAARPPEATPDPGQPKDPEVPDAKSKAPDRAGGRRAVIEAELAPYRKDLADGSLTRADLAKQFNIQGRQLLQAADYDAAIRKLNVAIHLNPRFAGAYSNRGTVYELQGRRDLAAKDFNMARQLGFGGVRPSAQDNPLR